MAYDWLNIVMTDFLTIACDLTTEIEGTTIRRPFVEIRSLELEKQLSGINSDAVILIEHLPAEIEYPNENSNKHLKTVETFDFHVFNGREFKPEFNRYMVTTLSEKLIEKLLYYNNPDLGISRVKLVQRHLMNATGNKVLSMAGMYEYLSFQFTHKQQY